MTGRIGCDVHRTVGVGVILRRTTQECDVHCPMYEWGSGWAGHPRRDAPLMVFGDKGHAVTLHDGPCLLQGGLFRLLLSIVDRLNPKRRTSHRSGRHLRPEATR